MMTARFLLATKLTHNKPSLELNFSQRSSEMLHFFFFICLHVVSAQIISHDAPVWMLNDENSSLFSWWMYVSPEEDCLWTLAQFYSECDFPCWKYFCILNNFSKNKTQIMSIKLKKVFVVLFFIIWILSLFFFSYPEKENHSSPHGEQWKLDCFCVSLRLKLLI